MAQRITLFLSCLAAAVALMGAPRPAQACGGFFCNASLPVNQAAERIIFAQRPDGSTTAVIQIQYSGPSESFAWMLPVAGSPDIGVSSDAAFTSLQGATNPTYTLNRIVEGECAGGGPFPGAGGGFSDAGAFPGNAGDGGAPPVMVVDRGQVGPYDFVIIRVDSELPDEDKPTVAVEWLQDNDYDVNDFGRDVLAPYLAGGMNLLAFRLTKGNEAGSIRPVMLSFGPGAPSIPLRPTAVAAEDDMGILVWVLGPSQAVPANYRSLELNEALINWFSPNATYNDVVTRAANEAGGQGFVTEMAGPKGTDWTPDIVYSSFTESEWENIQNDTWEGRHGELLNRVANLFRGADGLAEAIGDTVPVPAGLTQEELLACPSCVYPFSQETIEGLDLAAFFEAVNFQTAAPLAATRDLFEDAGYMTRLYTTMSGDEMTMDPVFDFNADLGPVSAFHQRDQLIECSPSVQMNDAPWRVELEDDLVVRGVGNTWPIDTTEASMPANARVRRVGTSGEGEVIEDNVGAIRSALSTSNAKVDALAPTASPGFADGDDCSAGGRGPMASLSLLGMVALLLRRRRRLR